MRAFLTESRPLSPPLSSVPPASVSLYNGGRGRSLSWRPACTQAGERASRTFHSDYLYNSAMAYSTLLYSTVLPSLPPPIYLSVCPALARVHAYGHRSRRLAREDDWPAAEGPTYLLVVGGDSGREDDDEGGEERKKLL